MKENQKIIGIDIGGSYTKAALISISKKVPPTIIYSTKKPTNINKKESMLFELIFSITDEILTKNNLSPAQINGIGISIAGMVLADSGLLLSASNLGLLNIKVAKKVQAKYKIEVKIGNDVSMFALAQAHESSTSNLVYIAIGTGINAGIINGGKILSGANGASIEYGHTQFASPSINSNQLCACGLGNCLECFVSGKAIIQAAVNLGIKTERPEDFFSQYNKNTAVKNTIDKFIQNLETVLLNICNTYRPEKIFIGGGIAKSLEPFIKRITQNMANSNYGYRNAPKVSVEISKLSTDGGMLGAALLFN